MSKTTGEQPLQLLDAQEQQQHDASSSGIGLRERREQLSDGEKAELAARAAEALEAEIDSVRLFVVCVGPEGETGPLFV
jgi:hypothetical protein